MFQSFFKCCPLTASSISDLLLVLSFQLETADCSSLPPVPPICLTLCEHQGAAGGKDASNCGSTKVEIRSTTKEMTTTTRRSHSAKLATKCSQTLNSCATTTALDNQLLVRGGPPAVNKPIQCPPGNTLSTCRRSSPPVASPLPNGRTPSVLSASGSATQEKQPTLPDDITGNLKDQSLTMDVKNVILSWASDTKAMTPQRSSAFKWTLVVLVSRYLLLV